MLSRCSRVAGWAFVRVEGRRHRARGPGEGGARLRLCRRFAEELSNARRVCNHLNTSLNTFNRKEELPGCLAHRTSVIIDIHSTPSSCNIQYHLYRWSA